MSFFGWHKGGTSKKHVCTSKFCKPMASDSRQFSDTKWPYAFPIACPMYLFVFGLFKDALNSSYYVASNGRVLIINECES
jgi:hypothetical protein